MPRDAMTEQTQPLLIQAERPQDLGDDQVQPPSVQTGEPGEGAEAKVLPDKPDEPDGPSGGAAVATPQSQQEELVEARMPANVYSSFIWRVMCLEKQFREELYGQGAGAGPQRQTFGQAICMWWRFKVKVINSLFATFSNLFLNFAMQFKLCLWLWDTVYTKADNNPDLVTQEHYSNLKVNVFLHIFAVACFTAMKDVFDEFRIITAGVYKDSPEQYCLSAFAVALCLVVLLQEVFIFIAVIFIGSAYILASEDAETMVLNCLSLAFITELDELIFTAIPDSELPNARGEALLRTKTIGKFMSPFVTKGLYFVFVSGWPSLFKYVLELQIYSHGRATDVTVETVRGSISYQAALVVFVLLIVGMLARGLGLVQMGAGLVAVVVLGLAGYGLFSWRGQLGLLGSKWWLKWLLLGSWALLVAAAYALKVFMGVSYTDLQYRAFCPKTDEPWPEELCEESPDGETCASLVYGKYAYSVRDGDYVMTHQSCRCKKVRSEQGEGGQNARSSSKDSTGGEQFDKPVEGDPVARFCLGEEAYELQLRGRSLWRAPPRWPVLEAPEWEAVDGVTFDRALPSPESNEPLPQLPPLRVIPILDPKRHAPLYAKIFCLPFWLYAVPLGLAVMLSAAFGALSVKRSYDSSLEEIAPLEQSDVWAIREMAVGMAESVGDGAWRVHGGFCPVELVPCELDAGLCVALAAGSPNNSAYARWCPVARSGRSCASLRRALGFRAMEGGAVPYCSGAAPGGSVTLFQARVACGKLGARLCRPSELDASTVSWSAEPCAGGGYWHRSGEAWACREPGAAAPSLCCADEDVEAWPCPRDLPGHTCSWVSCGAGLGPTNCNFLPALGPVSTIFGTPFDHSLCGCAGTHCAWSMVKNNVTYWWCRSPSEEQLRSAPRFQLVRRGAGCDSQDQYMGVFYSNHSCAGAVKDAGGRFFRFNDARKNYSHGLLGLSPLKKGKCYWEKTTSRQCPEGFQGDSFDFFEILPP
uniref:Uncharacterized protein n=1 Tax=Alexandrium monilatum TaxID=311494 RepID=A0A7S4QTJ3_9DINO